MMLSMCSIQICSQMRTKSHCIKTHKIAQYPQQHPTRLCKQLYPQIVGLLFSSLYKNNNHLSSIQLPQLIGHAV